MVLNHKRAIEFLVEEAESINFTRRILTNLHAVLAENLLADPSQAGRLRTSLVGIGSSVYTPLSIPQLISERLDVLLALLRKLSDPFEQALLALLHIPYLQPFVDVNKRTSRLAANIPLIKHNLRPLSFVDVPHDAYTDSLLVFYETGNAEPFRELFLWAYERSCQSYEAISSVMAQPDRFRLLHRDAIYESVADLVINLTRNPEEDADRIAKGKFEATNDQAKFSGMVLSDLRQLHEGNYMRYRIRPSQFEAWDSHRASLDW